MNECIVDIKKYIKIKKIGEGGFGKVYQVKEKQTGNIYAAKVSRTTVDENSILLISREVNTMSKITHPFIVKFIGFSYTNFQGDSKPVILTEYLPNGSLDDVLTLERRSLATFEWTETRKLINIYGIATSMLYLHQHKILHRDLKPGNILMDNFLCPKICDFGLSKIEHSNLSTQTINSTLTVKGTPAYIAPEIWKKQKYSKSSDVYSFGVLVYELITNEIQFKGKDIFEIKSEVEKGKRPKIPNWVPEHYSDLIKRCWSQDPNDRPSFKCIVDHLIDDPDFVKDLINKDDFLDFVEYTDKCVTDFESKKYVIPIDKFIKRKTKTFERVLINVDNCCFSENKIKMKKRSIYPIKEYMKLSRECKKLVDDAENNADLQFEVGLCLIEGQQNFPIQREIGIKYLESAIEKGSIDASIYYSKMLIKADFVLQDLDKAESILKMCPIKMSPEVTLLRGLIMKKRGDYENAARFFKAASKAGNGDGQYEYGKLLYKGLGVIKNKEEAMKLFMMSKNNGIKKCDKFLNKNASFKHQKQEEVIKNKKVTENKNDNSPLSLFYKGIKYYKGDGIPMNKSKAAQYYKMAADKENSDAMYNYACMLLLGDGIPVNKLEAARYFKMAIDKGRSDAMYTYACMLRIGDGIPMNKLEAVRYCKMSIAKGNSYAMNSYATMLQNGDGIPMNKLEAVRYYKMAIDKGSDYAMNSYAIMLQIGDGIPMNKLEAVRYYKMAINKGNSYAMYNYACMLKLGDGIQMDKLKASHYYKMAIDKGHCDAMYIYANMLNFGDGIPVNKVEAARYYKMAIDKGNRDAMNSYAIMLQIGDGIPMNKLEAARYYKMAIDKGNRDAMNNYAIMLQNGDGIPMNKAEAAYYFNMAVYRPF